MTITAEELARDRLTCGGMQHGPGGLRYSTLALKYIAEVERLQAENEVLNVMDVGLLAKECMLLRANGRSKDAEIDRLKTRNGAMAKALADLWMRHNGGDVITSAAQCPCSTCEFLAKFTANESASSSEEK